MPNRKERTDFCVRGKRYVGQKDFFLIFWTAAWSQVEIRSLENLIRNYGNVV